MTRRNSTEAGPASDGTVRAAIERHLAIESHLRLANSLAHKNVLDGLDDDGELVAARDAVAATAQVRAVREEAPDVYWARLVVAADTARHALREGEPARARTYVTIEAQIHARTDLDAAIGETNLSACLVHCAQAAAHLARAGRSRGVLRALAALEVIEELRP